MRHSKITVLRRFFILGVIALLSGCPLPYYFSGEGAGDDVPVDPSAPTITAPVTISFSEVGGVSGNLGDGDSLFTADDTIVTLSTETENAIIYYTTDGSAITSFDAAAVQRISSSNGSFTIPRTTGVETRDIVAVAVGSGMLPSPFVAGTVTVSPFPVLTISASDETVFDNGGTTSFVVTSSAAPDSDLTVNLYLDASSTFEAADVVGLGGLLPDDTFTRTLAAGSTSISIDITGQTDADGDNELIVLTVEDGTGYVVGTPASETVTVLDDQAPEITIVSSAATLDDDGASSIFTISSTFAPQADLPITVQTSGSYEVGDISVLLPAGTTGTFPGSNQSFVFVLPAGETEIQFTVTTVPDVGEFDNETLTVAIDPAGAYVVGTPSNAGISIADTSPVPVLTLSVDAASIVDTGVATFTINATEVLEASTAINLSRPGIDNSWVESVFDIIVFPGGQNSVSFELNPIEEFGFEERTVTYSLEPGVGYSVGATSDATVTVVDDGFGAFSYLGYWDFDGGATDSRVGTQADLSTSGSVLSLAGQGLISIDAEANPGYDDAVFPVTNGLADLDKNAPMTFGMRFRLGDFLNPGSGTFDRALIVGGSSYRWMSFSTDGDGIMTLSFNNGDISYDFGGVGALNLNTWYTVFVRVDNGNVIRVDLANSEGDPPAPAFNGEQLGVAAWPWDVEVAVGDTFDEVVLTSNRSNGREFDGDIDWVFVANGFSGTSPLQILNLIRNDPDL